MIENSILRQNAKNQLDGRIFGRTWLVMLVVFLVYSAILSFASAIGYGILGIVISGPMLFGLNRICVDLVRGNRDVRVERLFEGFTSCFTSSLILNLLISLYTFLWSLLFVIPGIVKSYSYAMAPYILQDAPSTDWEKCIDESQKMMNGNKWQLFCLDFSFIGWYILGALCFGVGVLWVYPYHYLARANFYMALKAKNEPRVEFDPAADIGYEPVDPFN